MPRPRRAAYLLHLALARRQPHPPRIQGSSAPGVFSRILHARAPALPAWAGSDLRRLTEWTLRKDAARRPSLGQLFSDPFVR
jgi:hypothetical protein